MRENNFYIFVPSDLDLCPLDLEFCSTSYSCPAPCYHKIVSCYAFPSSIKSEVRDAHKQTHTETDTSTDNKGRLKLAAHEPTDKRTSSCIKPLNNV